MNLYEGKPRFFIVLLLFLLTTNLPYPSSAITFDLPSRGAEECFEHHADKDTFGLFTYSVLSATKVDVKLYDAANRPLHHNPSATHGEQSFSTQREGNLRACFKSPYGGMKHSTIQFHFIFDHALTAIHDKDGKNLAKKERVKNAQEVLEDMFGIVESIEYTQERMVEALDRRYVVLKKGMKSVQFMAFVECLGAVVLAAVQIIYFKNLFVGKRRSPATTLRGFQV